jgi:hypothetical protein
MTITLIRTTANIRRGPFIGAFPFSGFSPKLLSVTEPKRFAIDYDA